MTYPPTSGPDGIQPPPPDPPIQPYQPPQSYTSPGYPQPPQAYQAPAAQDPYAPYGLGYAMPQYDYGNPGSPYGYPSYPPGPRPTEGMAIASLVVSCVSIAGLCGWWVGGLLGVLGAIFGHVARRKIRQTGAGGSGMALAGIIIGWVVTAIAVVGAVVLVAVIINDGSNGGEF
ncbi:DUF4190 domain-containing protein [Actinoplanes sp. NPDC049548]|uniref:DUF4190 domain-containing protein n=1 Tax=Actinoplanes sp. NPDC049548 TaxID=3155152 RepID=UPI0034460C2E